MEVFDILVDILTEFLDTLFECELTLPLIFVSVAVSVFIFVVRFLCDPFSSFGISRKKDSLECNESLNKITLNGKELE